MKREKLLTRNLCKPYLNSHCYTGINSSKLIILAIYEKTILVNIIEISLLFQIVPANIFRILGPDADGKRHGNAEGWELSRNVGDLVASISSF